MRPSLCALLLALCFLRPAVAQPATPPRTNILIILVDDLGWRDLGAYGQEFARTPRLDALAKEGARFTAAYAACPVCSPTRAALMTGQYPARINITDWIPGTPFPKARTLPPKDLDALPLDLVTLAEALRNRGYTACHIGKWHLGGEGFLPQDQGFDINLMGSHIGHPASYFYPYGNAVDGKPGASHAVPLPILAGAEGEYLTARQAEDAAAFVRRAAEAESPFFMHLSFYAVHTPLQAPEADIERYAALKASREDAAGRLPLPVYAAMLETLDAAIGRVLDELHAAGLEQSTLVMVTSDNGGLSSSTDNRPLRGGKRSLWEGGIRVPLLVRWPGVVKPGAELSEPVITQDLFATACEVGGATICEEARIDSRSLAGLLRGEAAALDRDALYWHFPQNQTGNVGPRGAIREGRWKLIEEYEDGRLMLFDLEADPSETNDLAGKERGTAERLAEKLRAWRATVGARMPSPNPNAAATPEPNEER
jgi:arylsulfatase A-like enzyme